jgi:periplasmic divalent cation tolerance protein
LTGVLVVTTTTGSLDEAEAIAAVLLERRIAACVHIGVVESRYVWKGRIAQDSELTLTIKTLTRLYPQVEAAIREMHSYEVPEILASEATHGSADYVAWVAASMGT